MMVGVPVLFIVCVSAFVPFTCVMAVVVGVSWWRVFQYCVAVVFSSRRVPGVLVWLGVVVVFWLVSRASVVLVWVGSGVGWLVSGVCGAKACVGWLVSVGVSWLVCVFWWFRMLTCLASFFFLVLSFVLSCCLVNNGSLVVWARVGVCLWGVWVGVGVFWGWLVVFALVCGRAKVCLSASCGLLGCCLCVGLA